MPVDFDLNRLLKEQEVRTVFQPIVSMRSKKVVGMEALTRGMTPEQSVIPPFELFEQAQREGRTLELDRLCRKTALETFKEQLKQSPDQLLFLNFEASLLDQGVGGSGALLDLVQSLAVPSRNVIIEIIESQVNDLEALEQFAASHRCNGFLLALDDIGSGHSNLERVARIKPDVIKLDRSLISGMDYQFYKKEIARALLKLGHKIGALVVAEGVETEGEAVAAMDLGVDMLQGFYFAKPAPMANLPDGCELKMSSLAELYRNHTIGQIAAKKNIHHMYDEVVENLKRSLLGLENADLDDMLQRLINIHPSLECIYVLDQEGVQISDSVCASDKISTQRKFVFQPAVKGSDQSLKNYFLLLLAGLDRYVSEPYISLASGSPCITISTWFKDAGGRDLVICADFDHELPTLS
jgi:EAL domain-containing protein (putative c-di-GMP-specific phosphodiesterase class I)